MFNLQLNTFDITILQQSMGNENSSYQERFMKKYHFIQTVQDNNFGVIKVYRRSQLNFDYVMVIDRIMSEYEFQECKEHFQTIKANYAKQRQPLLLRLYNIEELKRSQCGPKGIRLYIEYLNFTLKDIIQQRKSSYKAFLIPQLMLILQSVIQTYYYFRQLKFNAFSIRSDCIFITPEGYLRFSPIKILNQPNESEIQTCDCLQQGIVKNFRKSQRQFVIELKNLMQEVIQICHKNDELFYLSYQLLSKIHHSKTLEQLVSLIQKSQTDSLTFGKGPMESTQISSVRQKNVVFNSMTINNNQKRSLRSSFHKSGVR